MNGNHKNHKLMWNELARTGGNNKKDVISKLCLPYSKSSCYACDTDTSANKKQWDCSCENCPIQWTDKEYNCCGDKTSPYYRWVRAGTPRTRKKYAKIIANMEWREKK